MAATTVIASMGKSMVTSITPRADPRRGGVRRRAIPGRKARREAAGRPPPNSPVPKRPPNRQKTGGHGPSQGRGHGQIRRESAGDQAGQRGSRQERCDHLGSSPALPKRREEHDHHRPQQYPRSGTKVVGNDARERCEDAAEKFTIHFLNHATRGHQELHRDHAMPNAPVDTVRGLQEAGCQGPLADRERVRVREVCVGTAGKALTPCPSPGRRGEQSRPHPRAPCAAWSLSRSERGAIGGDR